MLVQTYFVYGPRLLACLDILCLWTPTSCLFRHTLFMGPDFLLVQTDFVYGPRLLACSDRLYLWTQTSCLFRQTLFMDPNFLLVQTLFMDPNFLLVQTYFVYGPKLPPRIPSHLGEWSVPSD